MTSRAKLDKKKLIRNFFLKAFACYLIWQLIYIGFLRPNGSIDDFLTELSIRGTVSGFNSVGIKSYNIANTVYINDTPAIRLENVCNGLELLALYIGFLICFPGRLKFKIVYGFIGCLVILLINIIREMLLAVNYIYFKPTFELNHKYTYTILVYLVVFLLWKHWVDRHSIISKKREQN